MITLRFFVPKYKTHYTVSVPADVPAEVLADILCFNLSHSDFILTGIERSEKK